MKNIKISKKLPLIIVLMTLLTSALVGLLSMRIAEEIMQDDLETRLESTLDSRKAALSNYLDNIKDDLAFVATNAQTLNALKSFKTGWNAIEGNKSRALQDLYINENPNASGEKYLLDYAADGSIYSQAHKENHPWFKQFTKARGYYDLFLFDLNGNLVYSVFKDPDYATNLKYGKYKDTDLGNAFRDAASVSAGAADQFFYDFKPYAASSGTPAIFISTPLYENGQKVGVLAYQMSVKQLTTTMSAGDFLGETGEAFMIGKDKLMRTQSKFDEKNTILEKSINNEAVANAFNGQTGFILAANYSGEKAFMAYDSVEFMGTTWALIAEQSYDEVMESFHDLEINILIMSSVLIVVLGFLGYLVSRSITSPLIQTNNTLQELAEGKYDIEIKNSNRGDEVGDLAKSALVFKQNAQEKLLLEEKQRKAKAQAEMDKKQAMQDLADKFEQRVHSIISNVASASTELSKTAESMTQIIQRSDATANRAASGADSASSNVQYVASATEEMSASISEISSQIQHSNELVFNSVNKVETAGVHAKTLSSASSKVREVVGLIADIANQINLLALNATIESARAGEAGKGFAVVASEVKNLAGETDKSIKEIEKVISEMNLASDDIVISLQDINGSVNEIATASNSIAAAIEEQSATTTEIAGSVQSAALGTNTITDNIKEVSSASNEASVASGQVLQAALELSKRSEELDSEVQEFLNEVRSS